MKIIVNNNEIQFKVFYSTNLIEVRRPKDYAYEYKCNLEIVTGNKLSEYEKEKISEHIRRLINEN